MDPVGDRPTVRDRDVRRDISAAEPSRDEVAVQHTCPALPRLAPSREQKLRLERWKQSGWSSGLRAHGQLNALIIAAHPCRVRIVGRINHVEAKAFGLELVDRGTQIRAKEFSP